MDSRLKGIILNYKMKSYKITPIDRANLLEVTMRFYWGFKYKSPSKRRQDKLRKEKFLAKFKRDPLLVPIPFLEPGQSPYPVTFGQPICWAIVTAFTTQADDIVEEIKMMHDKHNHLAQETEKAVKEGARMSNWVLDLKDEKYKVQREMQKLEHKLKGIKEDLAWLKARKKEFEASGLKGPIVTFSVLGLSQVGAPAEPRAQKRKRVSKIPRDSLACPQKRDRSIISHT